MERYNCRYNSKEDKYYLDKSYPQKKSKDYYKNKKNKKNREIQTSSTPQNLLPSTPPLSTKLSPPNFSPPSTLIPPINPPNL
jgi:hypothetical protein